MRQRKTTNRAWYPRSVSLGTGQVSEAGETFLYLGFDEEQIGLSADTARMIGQKLLEGATMVDAMNVARAAVQS